MRVALISCVKSKRRHPAAAADMYTSALFRGCRRYAEANADRWYILSARYRVLAPVDRIEPYEQTLNAMAADDRRAWARAVEMRLLELLPAGSHVTILAGERYREHLESALRRHGYEVDVPLRGSGLGQQLAWLKENT